MPGTIIQGSDSGQLSEPLQPVDQTGVMKVTAIKQQVKRVGRYSIFVSGKYAFSLSEGALLDQKIYVGQEVTSQQLADYKDTSQFDKYYGLTLAYVARRLRSEWELHDYFKRKKIDEDAGEQIIERLRNYGYVSDLNFARSWVDNRRAIKSVSRRRLIQELRQKIDWILRSLLHALQEIGRVGFRTLASAHGQRIQHHYAHLLQGLHEDWHDGRL